MKFAANAEHKAIWNVIERHEGDIRAGLDGNKIEIDHGLDEEFRAALIDSLQFNAQSEHAAGFMFGKAAQWAPDPEAVCEVTKVAFDEFRHGKYYYDILTAMGVDTKPMFDAVTREFATGDESGHAWTNYLRPSIIDKLITSWSDMVTFAYIIDPIGVFYVGQFARSAYGPMARAATRIIQEERSHLALGHRWAPDLCATEEGRRQVQEAADRLWPLALGLLGRPTGRKNIRQHELGVKGGDVTDLLDEYRALVAPAAATLGIRLGAAQPNYMMGEVAIL